MSTAQEFVKATDKDFHAAEKQAFNACRWYRKDPQGFGWGGGGPDMGIPRRIGHDLRRPRVYRERRNLAVRMNPPSPAKDGALFCHSPNPQEPTNEKKNARRNPFLCQRGKDRLLPRIRGNATKQAPPGYVLVELQRDDNLSLGDIYLKIDPGAPGLGDVSMFSYRIPHSGRYYQKERVIARMIAAYYGDARDARIEKELSNNSALDVLIADRQE